MARVLNGSQFYLHTPHSSAKGMNHTCLCLPSRSWYSFTDPGGMDSWVGLGWLVGYIPKQLSSTGNWSRTRSPISEVIMFHCGSDERPTTHLKHCLNLLINGLVSSRTSVCMCIIQCVCVCLVLRCWRRQETTFTFLPRRVVAQTFICKFMLITSCICIHSFHLLCEYTQSFFSDRFYL